VGVFPEGQNSRGDHGLGRLVEFRFKGPPGTTSSYITTPIIGRTSEVGYIPAMPRREDHEVHKYMWGHWTKRNYIVYIFIYIYIVYNNGNRK